MQLQLYNYPAKVNYPASFVFLLKSFQIGAILGILTYDQPIHWATISILAKTI